MSTEETQEEFPRVDIDEAAREFTDLLRLERAISNIDLITASIELAEIISITADVSSFAYPEFKIQ